MTTTAPEITEVADQAATPADLLARVRDQRKTADTAEAAVMELAVEWAHAHPALPGDESWKVTPAMAKNVLEDTGHSSVEEFEDYGIPPVHWAAHRLGSPPPTPCRPSRGKRSYATHSSSNTGCRTSGPG